MMLLPFATMKHFYLAVLYEFTFLNEIRIFRQDYKVSSVAGFIIYRQWDLKTGDCVRVYKGHTKPVTCVTFHEGSLYSSSQDNLIIQWNIQVFLFHFKCN